MAGDGRHTPLPWAGAASLLLRSLARVSAPSPSTSAVPSELLACVNGHCGQAARLFRKAESARQESHRRFAARPAHGQMTLAEEWRGAVRTVSGGH